jgi:UDP-N-acetylmuramoyl-tripeptide--D-alanyl-D-alanine ligase
MTLADVAARIGCDAPPPSLAEREVSGYSIDSRTAREGNLFFAVRGERLDGHAYVSAALEKGALAAVVDTPVAVDADRLLTVGDTLGALQGLAKRVLAEWDGTTVAITGSAGKTTTKELTARVLSAAGPTHKSAGNLNNWYGLPLSILEMFSDGRAASDFEYAVLEMGMSMSGEIRRLTEIAPPKIGVVTLVAPAHAEFFEDGIEGIARAKAELVEGIVSGGVAVLNADDERVSRMATLRSDVRTMTFGLDGERDVTARDVATEGLSGSRFRLVTPSGDADVSLPLVGRHNLMNALAAAGVGVALGLAPGLVAEALAGAAPAKMRGEVVRLANGAVVIDDSYNSNPRALREMIAALRALPGGGRRIVVAGEMLQLGAESSELHRDAGRLAAEGVDVLIGVRGDARHLVEGAKEAGIAEAVFVETPEEAAERLEGALGPGDVVLVKGSRGVATDRAVAALVRAIGREGTH